MDFCAISFPIPSSKTQDNHVLESLLKFIYHLYFIYYSTISFFGHWHLSPSPIYDNLYLDLQTEWTLTSSFIHVFAPFFMSKLIFLSVCNMGHYLIFLANSQFFLYYGYVVVTFIICFVSMLHILISMLPLRSLVFMMVMEVRLGWFRYFLWLFSIPFTVFICYTPSELEVFVTSHSCTYSFSLLELEPTKESRSLLF